MEELKFIFKGRLDFGNKRSFDNVLNMYEWKITNHYKKDVQFEEEELFDMDQFCLCFPRSFVLRGTKKNFHANHKILEYMAEFALLGQLEMWMIEDRKVIEYHLVEPCGDRAVISQYTKGKKLSVSEGKREEAIVALDNAIQKYENHAQAYERRAFVNTMMKKYHEAIRDYTKSINIYAGSPDPYYGRAVVHKIQENYEDAANDFDTSIKRSIPLQPIHWKSRRRKGECLMEIENFIDAEKELKFFNSRKYTEDNPNFKYRKKSLFNQGICLYEVGKYKEAIDLFDSSLEIEEGKGAPIKEELLYRRGLARHKAGLPDFKSDLKKAAKAGIKEAAAKLEEVS